MNSALRLDWKGDADAPADALLVETEVQWLQIAQTLRAPDADGVWVRGAGLCEWAAQWWQLAGGTCREVHNALDALLLVVPALERDEANLLAAALQSAGAAPNASLCEMLAALFPDFGDEGAFWRREVGAHNRAEFAAHWLLWLEGQSDIEASRAKLIAQQTAIWQGAQREWSALLPVTPGAARSALRCWLGLEPQGARGAFAAHEAFPVELPARWRDEASDFYARRLTRESDETGAALAFWREYERTNAPNALRKVAAQTLADWLRAHPQQLCVDAFGGTRTPSFFRIIGDFARFAAAARAVRFELRQTFGRALSFGLGHAKLSAVSRVAVPARKRRGGRGCIAGGIRFWRMVPALLRGGGGRRRRAMAANQARVEPALRETGRTDVLDYCRWVGLARCARVGQTHHAYTVRVFPSSKRRRCLARFRRLPRSPSLRCVTAPGPTALTRRATTSVAAKPKSPDTARRRARCKARARAIW